MISQYGLPQDICDAIKHSNMAALWAYVNKRAFNHHRLVHEACREGHHDCLQKLIKERPSYYISDPIIVVGSRFTSGIAFSDPLGMAINNGHHKCVDLMVRYMDKYLHRTDVIDITNRALLVFCKPTVNKKSIRLTLKLEKNKTTNQDLVQRWNDRAVHWYADNLGTALPLINKSVLHELIVSNTNIPEKNMFVLLKKANMTTVHSLMSQASLKDRNRFQKMYAKYEQTELAKHVKQTNTARKSKKM